MFGLYFSLYIKGVPPKGAVGKAAWWFQVTFVSSQCWAAPGITDSTGVQSELQQPGPGCLWSVMLPGISTEVCAVARPLRCFSHHQPLSPPPTAAHIYQGLQLSSTVLALRESSGQILGFTAPLNLGPFIQHIGSKTWMKILPEIYNFSCLIKGSNYYLINRWIFLEDYRTIKMQGFIEMKRTLRGHIVQSTVLRQDLESRF